MHYSEKIVDVDPHFQYIFDLCIFLCIVLCIFLDRNGMIVFYALVYLQLISTTLSSLYL